MNESGGRARWEEGGREDEMLPCCALDPALFLTLPGLMLTFSSTDLGLDLS